MEQLFHIRFNETVNFENEHQKVNVLFSFVNRFLQAKK